jgi:hypothetical protein
MALLCNVLSKAVEERHAVAFFTALRPFASGPPQRVADDAAGYFGK